MQKEPKKNNNENINHKNFVTLRQRALFGPSKALYRGVSPAIDLVYLHVKSDVWHVHF